MNHIFPSFPFPLPLCLDGATGTELIKAGMPTGVCPEQWILSHPEAIIGIQKRYVEAGTNAVLAPTFGANRAVLSRYGLSERTAQMNRELAALSRAAAPGALVGGDLSPTGKYLKPIGDTDADELIDVYREQAEALDELVDFFMIETNMDLACTRMAVIGAKKASTKPIFVTMTVTPHGKTMSGDDVEACFLTLSALGIAAFGLNCSTGPKEMKELLKPLVPLSLALGIPLIAKPNAGAPNSDGTHARLTHGEFADYCLEMAEGGIPILGGCCGTDADYIAKLSEVLKNCKSVLPCADRRVSRTISNARMIAELPDILPDALTVDDDFQDNADEMAEDEGFIRVRVESREDVLTVLEAAPFLSAPLLADGEEAALRELETYFCGKITVTP